MAAARQRALCLSLFLSPCFALGGRLFVSFSLRIGRYKKVVPFFSCCRETAVAFVVGPALVAIPVRLWPFFFVDKGKNQQDIAKARSPGRMRIARGVRIVYFFSYLHTISSILSSFFFFWILSPPANPFSWFVWSGGGGQRQTNEPCDSAQPLRRSWSGNDRRRSRPAPTTARRAGDTRKRFGGVLFFHNKKPNEQREKERVWHRYRKGQCLPL
nr:hypothetical protein [Pandoravirus belohorizontensis]